MLLPYLKVLQGKKVILGSQSKSRNELMTAQRLPYTVIPSKFEEDLDKKLYQGRPADYNMVSRVLCRTPVAARSTNCLPDSRTRE
jgi:predicted house-cleaning NTP pyrophosphatase (Maf/HAM1 superfamily)